MAEDLPATKHNDRTTSGRQLRLQFGDHDAVVGEGLLHCQQANLRDVEGVLAKRLRFAIVPLDEEGKGSRLDILRT